MANSRPTLYIGITNNLIRRVWEHKQQTIEGFTKEFRLNKLIYFEEYQDPKEAILREKQLKRWKRNWKLRLITSRNPTLKDLYPELV